MLPIEIMVVILNYLSLSDLWRVLNTSKQFYSIYSEYFREKICDIDIIRIPIEDYIMKEYVEGNLKLFKSKDNKFFSRVAILNDEICMMMNLNLRIHTGEVIYSYYLFNLWWYCHMCSGYGHTPESVIESMWNKSKICDVELTLEIQTLLYEEHKQLINCGNRPFHIIIGYGKGYTFAMRNVIIYQRFNSSKLSIINIAYAIGLEANINKYCKESLINRILIDTTEPYKNCISSEIKTYSDKQLRYIHCWYDYDKEYIFSCLEIEFHHQKRIFD